MPIEERIHAAAVVPVCDQVSGALWVLRVRIPYLISVRDLPGHKAIGTPAQRLVIAATTGARSSKSDRQIVRISRLNVPILVSSLRKKTGYRRTRKAVGL